jgi:hypothetical protein
MHDASLQLHKRGGKNMISSFNRVTLPTVVGAMICAGGLANLPVAADTSGAPPRVNSITPSSAPVGAQITVLGSGFDAPGLTLVVDGGEARLPSNQSGNDSTTTFSLPASATPPLDPHTLDLVRHQRLHVHMRRILLTPGTHQLAIRTAYGTSNAVSFTVSAKSP